MSTTYQPVLSDIADLFWWKVTKNIASNSPVNGANEDFDSVKLLPNALFVFVAWRGSTNYDPAVQLRATLSANTTLIYSAVIPSNFEVLVKRNNRFDMMDKPMPQAAICSSGYRAGNQVPLPIIYPPATTFKFSLYNTAETIFTQPDQTTVIPLRIDFGLFGYNVLAKNLPIFLNSWPELYGKAMSTLTGVTLPKL